MRVRQTHDTDIARSFLIHHRPGAFITNGIHAHPAVVLPEGGGEITRAYVAEWLLLIELLPFYFDVCIVVRIYLEA